MDIRRYQELGVGHPGSGLLAEDLPGNPERIERFMTTVAALAR